MTTLNSQGITTVILGEAAVDPSTPQGLPEETLVACLAANEALVHRAVLRRPLGILKYAMTLDGKIATTMGHSAWVSSSQSRACVFEQRAWSDAVIVGGNTVRRWVLVLGGWGQVGAGGRGWGQVGAGGRGWGQVGAGGRNWGQVGAGGRNWGQVGAGGRGWGQVGAGGRNWGQVGAGGRGWGQVGAGGRNWGQVGAGGRGWGQVGAGGGVGVVKDRGLV